MADSQDLKEGNVGETQTKYFTFGHPPYEIRLESGKRTGPVTIAYETYGKLNRDRSNAILIAHALSGDAHAAGYHKGDAKPGWWDSMIGPGKAFDTSKHFIVCTNVLGGCRGSTGPSSINPKTGSPFALGFPMITVKDMVSAQSRLIDHLGIRKLLTVVGGSMGGMQVLQWIASYPDRICSAIPISTTMKHSPQQIAFNEVGRRAIMADPDWNSGNYYGGKAPAKGLAIARMIGHITYMSDMSMTHKFGRRFVNGSGRLFNFDAEFEIENYLRYKGDNFVKRFDANSYLYLSKSIDYFDLSDKSEFARALEIARARFLVIAFESDWLYPAYQTKEIADRCREAGYDSEFHLIDSKYGHDAFLLETDEESYLIKKFLDRVSTEYGIPVKRSLEDSSFS
ncbi:MAG TPA: homoserine O-acetyltransferase [Euryarchaeota archaeon]|mgnify:CR=1 FL=1|nr:homoserine O-acetyltransferase [Euryarchaeota archaeon]